jgi:Rieske Fe-S protein
MLLGAGRRVWAQVTAAASPSYAPLTSPVRLPLDSVAIAWQLVPFTAEAVAPPTAETPGRRVIKGILYRKAGGSDPAGLSALCVTCPHEQCKVDLVTDPARLARMNLPQSTHPLFECGCHFSKFDAEADGAWLSGVAYRGLFRFRIAAVSDGTVEINGIEEEALSVI